MPGVGQPTEGEPAMLSRLRPKSARPARRTTRDQTRCAEQAFSFRLSARAVERAERDFPSDSLEPGKGQQTEKSPGDCWGSSRASMGIEGRWIPAILSTRRRSEPHGHGFLETTVGAWQWQTRI